MRSARRLPKTLLTHYSTNQPVRNYICMDTGRIPVFVLVARYSYDVSTGCPICCFILFKTQGGGANGAYSSRACDTRVQLYAQYIYLILLTSLNRNYVNYRTYVLWFVCLVKYRQRSVQTSTDSAPANSPTTCLSRGRSHCWWFAGSGSRCAT